MTVKQQLLTPLYFATTTILSIKIIDAFQQPACFLARHHLSQPRTTSLRAVDIEVDAKEVTSTTRSNGDIDSVSSLATPDKSSDSFDKFDYTTQWYPVAWAQDLPLDRPTQVTLFDTDYVVARIKDSVDGKSNENERIIAMEDRCPHKSAALSEGRVTPNGNFQCAYHGWAFDGKNGQCIEIPQVAASAEEITTSDAIITKRACGTAVPAMIQQGMVWLFPGGNLEASLLAPLPPSIPEIDMEGFQTSSFVRDFPVDWPILLENIMDPDHGLFAHQNPNFDMYSASKANPQKLEEEFTNEGKGWTISSKVDAVKKLTAFDKSRRGEKKTEKQKNDVEDAPIATTTFSAPCHVTIARRDKGKGSTKFISAFWVCPVGTGRSRFMSATVAKMPFAVPRWLSAVSLLNFLDQDTVLLATQQKHILEKEAEKLKQIQDSGKDPQREKSGVRKNLFVYRSPTEKLGVRLGAFFDATLNRVPKRVESLLASNQRQVTTSREVVLDRYNQHTRICPDSQKLLKTCSKIKRRSAVASILVVAAKALAMISVNAGFTSSVSPLFNRLNSFLRPALVGWTIVLSSAMSWLARKIQRQFYFKYDESYRNKDLDKIPQHWLDK